MKETYAALSEHLAGRKWLNYLNDDQGDDAVRAAYGPNFDRLREVKRRVDPTTSSAQPQHRPVARRPRA